MDISDEELFDVTPSCSISTTNTSLNLTEQTKNLTQDPIQEKDCNILTKDISIKLTRLPNVKKRRTNSHSFKSKKRCYSWKYGFLKSTQFYKREKKAKSSKSSKSQQAFRNMESTEVKSGPSENGVNEQISTRLYNQSYKAGEYGDAQQNKQAAQKETKNFILSTCQVQEENLCTDETNVCARTLPFKFYRKNSITSNNVNAIKCSDSLLSPSNDKNTELSSHSDKSYLSDSLSSKAKKRLIHTRLKFMAKRMGKQLDEWKFKRKSVTSDSETDEQFIPKRSRRLSSNDSDNEDAAINSIEVIGDNNQNESHLSLKKIDEKETNIQISRTVQVILTRLEEIEDEEVINWRENKTKPSDIIASEPVEEQQLDRRKLVRNLVTLESQDKLILPKEDRVLEMKDIPKDSPLITTNNCIERRYAKSKLNKLRKKYKLFKKPRVLMIKLDTLQCSSKNGRYSAIEIDCLTKKYVNFVINVNFHSKSHGLKMYRHVHLQRSTSDVNTYSEDYNISPSVSRTQNTNTRFKPPEFTEENSMKDVEAIENNDKNVPFKIHRKFARIQNRNKASSPGISEKKNNILSPKRLEIWRNAFRTLMITEKSQKSTASVQSTSTSKTLHTLRNSPKKSINAECESVIIPSTPTSSTKHNTVESPRKLASSKKQTEASTKPTECDDTSKFESFIRHENLPNDANVEQIISRSDFTQSKDSTVSKSPLKNAKDADVTISDTSLNSSKKILHEKANNLELLTNDVIPVKSKTSEVCGVEQSSHEKERAYRCHLCDASFKNDELLLKHMAMNLYKSCAVVNPTSNNASKCMEASNETITNKKHSQNLEKSKLSTLQQQCSSVNSESSSHQLDKSVIDSDMEIPSLSSSSSSSRGSKTRREHFRISQRKTKTRSTAKSKSDFNLDSSNREKMLESKNRSINMKLKRATCKICLQVFDTQAQLLQHMFKHFANDLRNMYTSIENKLDSEHQEPNENNNQVSDDLTENSVEAAVGEAVEVAENNINEQEKNLPENTNESSAENLVASEVSQHDTTKEGNEALNLSSAEFTKEQDLEKQLTSVASNAEHGATKVQCAEKEKSCVAGPSLELQPMKSFTICACHRPKTNRTTGTNVQIEIVLLCTTCQTLFRRFECFESHCTPRSAEGTLCGKNRRNGRKSKLLCVSCQQMLNSVQDVWHHLVMHSRLNRTSTATFYCNICKVIFYGLGQLFYNHFQNHAKNPFFLASRLSFPRPSYIGSKLIKLPATDNDKSIEVYMQVADYVCNECRTPFITAQNLKSHKTVCQNATTTVDPRSGSSDGRGMDSITSSKAPVLLVCGFCNKTFYSRTSFEVHSLEHTQKRDMHIHYTCVAVTAVTKVYICKVCTTMWQSLQSFEEHWLTHGILQEEYICSRCQNHYSSIDLFQKHTITTHSDSDIQQLPITCEVIYRDISDQNSKTNSQKNTVDDLPYMDLSCFDSGKDDAEKIANDEPSQESQELTDLTQNSLKKLLFGNRSTQVKAMISPELSECSNKEVQATKNVPQVPVQIPSSNAAVAQSKRSSNSNSENVNDDSDEEEELTIVLSESEESSVSNGVRKNADGMPSTKHQNAQEKTKSTTSEPAVTDGQMQCSNDAVSVDASAKTLNDVSESANSNGRISVITPRESVNTQLSTNANISKNKTLACSTSVTSTTETQISHANKTLENSVAQLMTSDTNSSREGLKELLPKNVMSVVPKSFLRVKSLAELTNIPPSENQLCGVCGLSFESRHKLKGHMAKHNRQDKQSEQTSLSDNVPIWPAKPTFNPLAHIPTTSTQDRLLPLVPINNVSPSVSVRPHSPRVIDTTNSRQYQVVGVKPLPSVKSSTITNTSRPKESLPHEVTSVPSLNNVTSTIYRQNISQKTAYHQNLPPHISHPLNKSAQSAQQQQSTGTVAIRPFLQTTYSRPSPLPYSQQQSQQLQQQSQLQQQPQQLQQQPSQSQQQPQQQQHQPQLQQLLQQQHPQSQQQQQQSQPLRQQPQPLRQQPQLLRQQPQQLQQQQQPQQLQQVLQQQQPQQLQQQLQQRQQSQQLQQQLQLQLQLQQQMQQQQQQQQQQINVGNNVVHYLISKTGMSYQMTSNNIIPANADNVMVVAVNTMQQVSKDPERYICLYCPGFECSSVQEFALHEHSPKHEARSHYNGVAYVPQA